MQQLQQSQHIGGGNYEFFPQSLMWPNMSGFPNITGLPLYFCIQDMLQGRSFPVQPNIIGQKFDMYPYFHLFFFFFEEVSIFSS